MWAWHRTLVTGAARGKGPRAVDWAAVGRRSCTLIGVETLGSTQVYANPWMVVREDVIRRPDGSTGVYGVIDTADIALVIASEGVRLHLVEQYRYPVAGRRWEFPSGTADPRDADPAALAARELREETGLVAGALTGLGALEVSPSTFGQRCHVFWATDLTHDLPQRDLEEQEMRSAWFTRLEVEQMIGDGTLIDAKSLAAYTLLLLHERDTGGRSQVENSR